ncbi:MAG: hypothetical protein R3B74_01045 [Nitrospirales bacterium]|nr:hypothetical protein [Nitrospirales bacterium]
MSSIAKRKTESKKAKCLGASSVLRPDQYKGFEVDSKVECIRALIPLGLMHVREVLDEEVCTLGVGPASPGLQETEPVGGPKSDRRA